MSFLFMGYMQNSMPAYLLGVVVFGRLHYWALTSLIGSLTLYFRTENLVDKWNRNLPRIFKIPATMTAERTAESTKTQTTGLRRKVALHRCIDCCVIRSSSSSSREVYFRHTVLTISAFPYLGTCFFQAVSFLARSFTCSFLDRHLNARHTTQDPRQGSGGRKEGK